MKRLLFGAAAALVLSTATVSAARSDAIAAINLNLPTYATTASSSTIYPRLGDSISFSVSYPKNLDHYGVRVQVLCYQNGAIVWGTSGPYTLQFGLGGASSAWLLTNGDADCVANLYYWSYSGNVQTFNFLAETQFHAYAK